MKSKVECPYCDGSPSLHHQVQEIAYKKEAFQIKAHYYQCESCGQDFTTTSTDELSMTQLYNLYREQHRIPYPEEIAAIRKQYGLSATAMSEVLGLGVNGYGQYEKGEMPTEAIGNLILSAKNPWTFKTMLEGVHGRIPENAFNKALQNADELIELKRKRKPFYNQIDLHRRPSAFTGFKTPNKDIVGAMVGTFISRCNLLLNDRLKINKLLFYADFLAFKNSGYSISGLSYRAIQFGPVPSCYDNIFALLENESIIYADWQLENGSSKELFFTPVEPNMSLFNEFEKVIVDIICDKFQDTTSWDLVEMSHNEKGWIEQSKGKGLISYQDYAFELSEI